MNLEQLQHSDLIIFEAVSGSKAYGLDTPASDTDIRGVFMMPKENFYGLSPITQVANDTNDIVYYELGKLVYLLSKNNPNALELVAMPNRTIRKTSELYQQFTPDLFLSKKCHQTFAGYAFSQIKKARGLNKKIVQPMAKERKTVIDFCHVVKGGGSLPLNSWLVEKSLLQEECGLATIPHFRDCFSIYHSESVPYKGILRKENANDVATSSIPKGEKEIGILYFNRDAYSIHCKKHKEYWDWVSKRNKDRFETNAKHGKNYDSKNMMHTFRLLETALDIAQKGEIILQRPNRDFLLSIKNGDFEYDDLIAKAEKLMAKIEEAFLESHLPDEPDLKKINDTLIQIRHDFYSSPM